MTLNSSDERTKALIAEVIVEMIKEKRDVFYAAILSMTRPDRFLTKFFDDYGFRTKICR